MFDAILAQMAALKLAMNGFDPRLWPVSIAVLVGLSYWLWRTVHPKSFDELPSKLKALPGAILAAVVSGLAGQELWGFILDTVIGSLTAGGGHELIERLRFGSKAQRVQQKKGS